MNRKNHHDLRSSPHFWRRKAEELLASANCIRASRTQTLQPGIGVGHGREFGEVEFMLAGMAIECALKGIVSKSSTTPEFTHDINALARQAGIVPTPDLHYLLGCLTETVTWRGRFPVAKSHEKTQFRGSLGDVAWADATALAHDLIQELIRAQQMENS